MPLGMLKSVIGPEKGRRDRWGFAVLLDDADGKTVRMWKHAIWYASPEDAAKAADIVIFELRDQLGGRQVGVEVEYDVRPADQWPKPEEPK